jgi:nitrogen fixation NifU-like protein
MTGNGGPAAPSAPPALYTAAIRERWRRPRFRGDLAGATAVAEDVNPLCGDRVRMSLAVGDDGTVTAARFTGDACAICTASADVVAELVTGRPASAARALTPADVLEVLQADIRPTRMRCLMLPLAVLETALEATR